VLDRQGKIKYKRPVDNSCITKAEVSDAMHCIETPEKRGRATLSVPVIVLSGNQIVASSRRTGPGHSLPRHALQGLLIFLVFASAASAAPVDYSDPYNWAAFPTVPNASMHTPVSSLHNHQATASADVFYVYPTVFADLFSNNAQLNDKDYRQNVADLLELQASTMNGIARVYAPYYRQASLWVWFKSEATRKHALDRAYQDIEAAFQYYLEHFNHHRPLFILAHSQGSEIAVRLLQTHFTRSHLDRILVAAYLIGERIGEHTFGHTLPPCITPKQTGCFITWGTVAKGGTSRLLTGNPVGAPVCINPLTWKMDTNIASSDHHQGAVPYQFNRLLPSLVHSQCIRGLLNIWPEPESFSHEGKDFHESDINLFYMDIRHNAEQRLQQFRISDKN